MLFLLLGGFCGFVVSSVVTSVYNKKVHSRYYNARYDIFPLLFIIVCTMFGAGIGFLYGSQLLFQHQHPFNRFISYLAEKFGAQ